MHRAAASRPRHSSRHSPDPPPVTKCAEGVRYLTEGKAVSLLTVQLATSALAELRAGDGQRAAKLLSDLAR
jgi:hypothetical protein